MVKKSRRNSERRNSEKSFQGGPQYKVQKKKANHLRPLKKGLDIASPKTVAVIKVIP